MINLDSSMLSVEQGTLSYSFQQRTKGSSKSPDGVSQDWTYGLTSLLEKTQKYNHLQMLEQWKHLFLIYFKILGSYVDAISNT